MFVPFTPAVFWLAFPLAFVQTWSRDYSLETNLIGPGVPLWYLVNCIKSLIKS